MPFANSRAINKPRADFQAAGGTQVFYRHPVLAGQISAAIPIDQIDVSGCLQLNSNYLDANPTHDSSVQEIMVDGSTVTITNHIMAGEMNLQVVRKSELVGDGDLIAALHLVIASKDSQGGVITRIKEVNGRRICIWFYGVAAKRVPHLKEAGNAVVPHPVVLTYSGWVQAVSEAKLTSKVIWAVGNKTGIRAVYNPYKIQGTEVPGGAYFDGKPLQKDAVDTGSEADTTDGDFDANIADTGINPDYKKVVDVQGSVSWT